MTKSRSDKGIILIVDDQPENLQILTAILAEQDYEVQQALNGRLALKATQESPPDLILLDVRLPDMSGYDVCERLKAGESTRDIPIIFVSVVGETEDKIKAFAAGGVDYMTKPLQVEEVLARVETHLVLRAMQKQLEEKNAQLEREADERKQAEERQRVLSLAVEKSPSSIAILNRQGVVEYANPRLLELYDLDLEQVIGKHWRSFLPPHSTLRERYAEIWKAVVEGVMWRGEVTDRARDGKAVWREAALVPIKDAKGEHVHTVYVSEDVTERKRAEEALRESKELFEKTFASQRDAIFILDAANPPTILDCNPAATAVFGYTRQEVLGRTTGLLHVGEAGLRGFQKMLYPAIAERGFLHLPEFHMKRKDGVVFPTEHTVVPLKNERGERIGWISVVRDIAERKQLEEQLRQQERLAAIGQLAGGIAHDFNNLLTSIILYAQILKSKPGFPPDLAPNVETILDESRHAAKLVQQILDFGRRSMIETRSVDLVPLVEKTADILRRALPENIRLILDIGTGEHSVHADPTRIQQVVMNLATNARDAMPEGGELRIGLSRVQAKREQDTPLTGMPVGEWVCLAVSDTGTGMAKDVRQHLFEPFFTTKPPGEGTGLGLAQVYGIVKQHEGHIGVETEAGCGTTFRVYLPIHRGATEEAAHETVVLPRGKGETILLVEDEERLREVGREILESLRYQVLTAKDGHEALDAYRSATDIDLVITDLVMPVMGGVQLIQELKKVDPRVKALAITGYALTADKRELREAGLLDVVHKPFDAGTLGETVRRILDSAR